MFKKIIIWFLEIAIPVFAYVLPSCLILELFPALTKNEDITLTIGLIVGFIFIPLFREYLQRKNIIPKFIEKISKKKHE